MRYFAFITLILAFISMGCVHTRVVDEDSFATLNEKLAGKKLIILLKNGQIIDAQDVKVDADSTSWAVYNRDSINTYKAANENIEGIKVIKRGTGAAEGLGFGILSGVTVGALIGSATYKECDPSGFMSCFMEPNSRGDAAAWGAAAGGFLGLILGPLVGVSMGSKDKYIFSSHDTLSVDKPQIARIGRTVPGDMVQDLQPPVWGSNKDVRSQSVKQAN